MDYNSLISGILGALIGSVVSAYFACKELKKERTINLLKDKIVKLYAPVDLYIDCLYKKKFLDTDKLIANLNARDKTADENIEQLEISTKILDQVTKFYINIIRNIKEIILQNHSLIDAQDLEIIHKFIEEYMQSKNQLFESGFSEEEIDLAYKKNTFNIVFPSQEFCELFHKKHIKLNQYLSDLLVK